MSRTGVCTLLSAAPAGRPPVLSSYLFSVPVRFLDVRSTFTDYGCVCRLLGLCVQSSERIRTDDRPTTDGARTAPVTASTLRRRVARDALKTSLRASATSAADEEHYFVTRACLPENDHRGHLPQTKP